MENDFNKAQKLSEYSVYKCKEDKFIENFSTIIQSAKFSIQEISTQDGDKVYLVPKELYQAAIGFCLYRRRESSKAIKKVESM